LFLFIIIIIGFYFELLGSNCQMRFKTEDKHEVITVIDQPTSVLDMDKLSAADKIEEIKLL